MPKRRVTSTVNHPKGLDTGAFVGVIALPVAALFFLLQANGVVTVGWWISGLIYLVLTAALICAFYSWEVPTRWSPSKRHFACSVGSLIVLALSGFGVRSEYIREHRSPSPRPIPPNVEVSYDLVPLGLPLRIRPGSEVYIVQIEKNCTLAPETLTNSGTSIYYWPTKKIVPEDSVGKIEVVNEGDAAVFNFQYRFDLRIGSPKSPGGEKRLPVEFPLTDLPIGKPSSVYIIDHSGIGGLVDLSSQAKGQVQGNSEQVPLTLAVRSLTLFDQVRITPITVHHWNGDQLLDPDLWHEKQ